MSFRTRIGYFISSSTKSVLGQGFDCPSCGSRQSKVVDSKYLVTELRRCEGCHLLFRAPTTSPREASSFYQRTYAQGFTTTMPSREEVDRLIASRFEGSEKCFSGHINVLKSLGVTPGARILDYGCSWGYGSWQLAHAGFAVQGFEISAPRCSFARETLHVNATSAWDDVRGPFDVIFAAHVFEHIPTIKDALDTVWRALRPGGLLLGFTPNGSACFRARSPRAWSKLWGYVHPNLIDEVFYKHHFKDAPMLLASDPYSLELMAAWSDKAGSVECDLSGSELVIAARKPLATS